MVRASTIAGSQNTYSRSLQNTQSAGKNQNVPAATSAASGEVMRRPMARSSSTAMNVSAVSTSWKIHTCRPKIATRGASIHVIPAPP